MEIIFSKKKIIVEFFKKKTCFDVDLFKTATKSNFARSRTARSERPLYAFVGINYFIAE